MLKSMVLACFYIGKREIKRIIIMSVGFNNTNYNINTGAVGSTGQSVNSHSISGSGSNAAIDMVDAEKQELLKRLNLTSDEYAAIVKNNREFPTLDEAKQLKIVEQYREKQISAPTEISVKEDAQVASSEFDRAVYNSKSKDEKFDSLKYEFAKNIFIYGIKDSNGVTVAGLSAHSPEEWNNMSEAQKQQFITHLMDGMKNDANLQEIGKSIKNFAQGMSENAQIGLIDSTMRTVQVANSKNLSFLEFMGLDEYAKIDAVEEYLDANKDTLNSSDETYLKINKFLKSEMIKSLENRGVGLREEPSMSEVAEYARLCNLDPTEEALRKLKTKKEQSGLSKEEEQWFKELSKFDTGNGKHIIEKSKASNLIELQKEFDELNEKMTSGQSIDQGKYNTLLKYLSSDEAKYLREEVIPNLPQPETDYEKGIASEIEELKSNLTAYINDSRLINAFTNKYIEDKTSSMSQAEKEEYIRTFLKFNNDTTSVSIIKHFGKEIPNLYGDVNTLSESNAATDGETTAEQLQFQNDARIKAATSGNSYLKARALDGAKYSADKIIADGNDNQKSIVSQNMIDLNELGVYSQDENDILGCKAVDLNKSIDDVEKERQAQANLENSSAYNTTVRNYTTDHIGEFHAKNQLATYEAAITGDKDAAAHASENGSVSKMAAENQTEGFDLLYNRLNEYFEGDEAVKYLNNLSDQIQDCDKNNQLDMHNRIMESQYSEVQEHAAGNIGNYDPSVQSDAMDSVYATGNQNAIEAAVESIVNSPSSDVIERELPTIVMEASKDYSAQAPVEIINDSTQTTFNQDTLKQKIASGSGLSPQEYASLTSSQKREYFSNYFKKLPLEQKIKLLSSLPNGSLKKSVYTAIARLDSNLFTAIVKDKDRADMLLSMGLPADVNQKIDRIVSFLAVSDVGYQNIAKKYDIVYGEEQRKSSYSTNPNGFDYKDIMKTDKYGNILA